MPRVPFPSMILIGILFQAVAVHAVEAPISQRSGSFAATFDRLKQQSLHQAPDLNTAQALADQKGAQVYTSISRWLPRLDLQFSQSRGIDYSIITSGALGDAASAGSGLSPFSFTPDYVSRSRWSLNLNFPLYRRSVHLGLQQSLLEREQAAIERDSRVTEMDWRLRQALGNYLLQMYRITTLKTSMEIARTTLREAKLRFELGERARVDVIRAEANLASLDSRAQSFAQDLATAESALIEYAGLTRSEFRELKFSDLFQQGEGPTSQFIDEFSESSELQGKLKPFLDASASEQLHSQIVESSPVYRSNLAEQAASNARARNLMAQEWPELALQGSLSKQAGDWNDALTSGNQSKNLALVLTIPIFSSGSLFSAYSEQSNAQRVSEIRRERDVLRLKDEVEDTVVQIRALDAARASQELALKQNDELVRLSRKTYQLGKNTLLELQTSENDLLTSKLALAQTKINLAVSLRRFAWNLGVKE